MATKPTNDEGDTIENREITLESMAEALEEEVSWIQDIASAGSMQAARDKVGAVNFDHAAMLVFQYVDSLLELRLLKRKTERDNRPP